jgi:hypothetical protein
MILQVMCPSFSISPDFADTKLMGLRGISILARACLASSSIIEMLTIIFVDVASVGDGERLSEFTISDSSAVECKKGT